MTLKINGVDYSTYIQQKTDITETPRYVNGINDGKITTGGRMVFDRIATKYDPSFTLKPLPEDKLRAIAAAIEAGLVRVTYTSFRADADIEIKGQGRIDSISYATMVSGVKVYQAATISFIQE